MLRIELVKIEVVERQIDSARSDVDRLRHQTASELTLKTQVPDLIVGTLDPPLNRRQALPEQRETAL
jgi:hypothetical protein